MASQRKWPSSHGGIGCVVEAPYRREVLAPQAPLSLAAFGQIFVKLGQNSQGMGGRLQRRRVRARGSRRLEQGTLVLLTMRAARQRAAPGLNSPAASTYLCGTMLSLAAPSGFIEPCLPSFAERPPSDPNWIHEIKHDGYRLMARRDLIGIGIRLLTRNGNDWGVHLNFDHHGRRDIPSASHGLARSMLAASSRTGTPRARRRLVSHSRR